MASIPYFLPSPYRNGVPESAPLLNGLMTNGQTIVLGDLLIQTGAGTISKGASNTSTNILGFAAHNGADVYFSGIGGSAAATSHQSFFGASVAGTGLMSSDPLTIHYWAPGNGVYAEMSLVQTFAQSSVGATVGITLDGTTGIFVADTTATAIGQIVRLVESVPGFQSYGSGGIGDTGARVLVRFNAAALAV